VFILRRLVNLVSSSVSLITGLPGHHLTTGPKGCLTLVLYITIQADRLHGYQSQQLQCMSMVCITSEMTYNVSSWTLTSTHSLTLQLTWSCNLTEVCEILIILLPPLTHSLHQLVVTCSHLQYKLNRQSHSYRERWKPLQGTACEQKIQLLFKDMYTGPYSQDHKECNILTYGMPFYDITYSSYKL